MTIENTITKEEIEARISASKAKKAQFFRSADTRRTMGDYLKSVQSSNNLQFVHLRKPEDYEVVDRFGGATVAFALPHHRSNVVEISIAWCRDNEAFDKLAGKFHSAQEFVNGKRIKLRLRAKGSYSYQLKELLSPLL